MKGLRIAMFVVGVLIVLVGLSLILVTRLEIMRTAGRTVLVVWPGVVVGRPENGRILAERPEARTGEHR